MLQYLNSYKPQHNLSQLTNMNWWFSCWIFFVLAQAPAKYEGLDFHTRALQHSKIHISWDEDEPQRAKTLKRKYNDDEVGEIIYTFASDQSDNLLQIQLLLGFAIFMKI